MDRKGQVTVFVIVAIMVLLVTGGLFFVARKTRELETKREIPEFASLKNFVESCLEKTGEEGIYFIARRGGYYSIPEGKEDMFYFSPFPYILPDGNSLLDVKIIPFYFRPGRELVPEESDLESELSRYVEQNMEHCVSEFSFLQKQGYTIDYGEPQAQVSLTETKTKITLVMPITFRIGAHETTFDTFTQTININLRDILGTVQDIAKLQDNEKDFVPLSYLTNLAFQKNFTYETVNFEDQPVIQYTLIFPQMDKDSPLIYNYLVEYDWSNTHESS